MAAVSAAVADSDDLHAQMRAIGAAAREAAAVLALCPAERKTRALRAMAAAVRRQAVAILDANARDMAGATEGKAGEGKAGQRGLSAAMLDRLKLDASRVEAMARGLEDVGDFPDPVGSVLAEWARPNGLKIARVRVPLGVIGIIYESRPNVTADAAGLCLRAGNSAILRGGSESFHSSGAITAALHEALAETGLPQASVQLVPTRDRAAVGEMLRLSESIDIIVPRGGRGLIERIQAESRIPVIAHLDGLCHTYVDGAADPAKARAISLNAKMRRTGVCGATETLLVDRKAAALLPLLVRDLIEAGCEVRGDAATTAVESRVVPATAQDWDTEYLDAIISVKVVDGVEGAIAHIARHGSHHTESIVTEDAAAAERFVQAVDAGIVLVNASTQFADGGEFGMGAEIGISTGKLHARGPVGAEQLTSYKYIVRGNGQVRP
jgi:glutamate-5-semialdehyde dehydrogenase